MGAFSRLDAGAARVEAALATAVLLTMVLVASAQALSFNLAERDLDWARGLLDQLTWVDVFLQKGTLWLAFLGASLATHKDKHIGIDVLPRLASGRARAGLKTFAALGSGVIALLLAAVYLDACLVADAAIPFEYEQLTPEGPAHVCDVRETELGDTRRPMLLCALRQSLSALGVPVSSGAGIAQLIAPLMFMLIGARLLGRGLRLALFCLQPPPGAVPPRAERESPGSAR